MANDRLYYEIGGGSHIPYSHQSKVHNIELQGAIEKSGTSVCTRFNPALSVKNSLNDTKKLASRLGDMEDDLLKTATGAILTLGPYILAKSNPTLYQLFQNAYVSANERVKVAFKDCQRMENDIQNGKNPYEDIIKVSTASGWRKQMSLGGDIHQAQTNVANEAPVEGITWLYGQKQGGLNQEKIHLTRDTVGAGFDFLAHHSDTEENKGVFKTKQEAMSWVVSVVGDYQLSTVNAQESKHTVGLGLLPQLEAERIKVLEALQNIMTSSSAITERDIKSVSAPGILINQGVLQDLRLRNQTQQQWLISRLSEEVATARILEKAWAAKQLLHLGVQETYISQVDVADNQANKAINRIDNEINMILEAHAIKQQLVSNTVMSLLVEQQQKEQQIRDIIQPTEDFVDDLQALR